MEAEAWEDIAWAEHLESPLEMVTACVGACHWAANTFDLFVAHSSEFTTDGFNGTWGDGWEEHAKSHEGTADTAEPKDEPPGTLMGWVPGLLVKS